jgi:hypothetical protein
MAYNLGWQVEHTDTFGRQANYSWVNRRNLALRHDLTQAGVMRHAKASVGLTGCRGRTYNHGDLIEFRPYGRCEVMFVTFIDKSYSSEAVA